MQGTPASFINGRKIGGAYPYETFKKVVEQELAKAAARGRDEPARAPRSLLVDRRPGWIAFLAVRFIHAAGTRARAMRTEACQALNPQTMEAPR